MRKLQWLIGEAHLIISGLDTPEAKIWVYVLMEFDKETQDIAYVRKNLIESLKVPKEFLISDYEPILLDEDYWIPAKKESEE